MQNSPPNSAANRAILALGLVAITSPLAPRRADAQVRPSHEACSVNGVCDPLFPRVREDDPVPARLTVRKSVKVLADPINDVTNPKAIPGALVAYDIEVENVGDGEIDADTQVLQDPVPANTRLAFSERFPMAFDPRGSGLTLRHGDRSAPGDVEFSTDGGATWTHSPTGSDAGRGITNVRFRPKGAMRPRSNYVISVVYMLL